MVYVLIGPIEQSLVVADEDGDSYRMLETVREYMLFGVAGHPVAQRARDYFIAAYGEVAGLLPAELQNYTVSSPGMSSNTQNAGAAEAFIKFLMTPEGNRDHEDLRNVTRDALTCTWATFTLMSAFKKIDRLVWLLFSPMSVARPRTRLAKAWINTINRAMMPRGP